MPVNLLLCEGEDKSPDVLVLGAVTGIAIRPSGSKYGLPGAVLARREVNPRSVVAAIRDRDLDDTYAAAPSTPLRWTVDGGAIWIGWRWERVEVESYLLDPEVVRRALGERTPDPGSYRTALTAAAESIAAYTAARTALSQVRPLWYPLTNFWGQRRGRLKHPLPDDRGVQDCHREIGNIVAGYRAARRVTAGDVRSRFRELLPFCRPGGERFEGFLTWFSGKDLLSALRPELPGLGFEGSYQFRAAVLRGIETATEPVWTWLPEWQRLHDQVCNASSNQGPAD